jgi:hypothetical protein
MEQREAQTRELIKDSNKRMERIETRTMERFEKLEDRIMVSMNASIKQHDARMDAIH